MRKRNTLHNRINLIIICLMAAVFVAIVVVELRSRDTEIREQIESSMEIAVDNMYERIVVENIHNREKITASLRLFTHFLRQSGKIVEENDSIVRQVTNFYTGETVFRKVARWTINRREISNVQGIIDNVYSMTGSLSALYQKMPEGYVVVASNFNNSDKNVFNDTYIPNDLEIIPAVENGEIYTCNLEIMKRQYVASFFPLFINSKISGMLSCFREFSIGKDLLANIKSFKFENTGYYFVVCPSAKIFVHPEFENVKSLHAARVMEHLKKAENSTIFSEEFVMPDKDVVVYQKIRYIDELGLYVGVCINKDEIGISLYDAIYTFVVILLAFAFVLFIILLINKYLFNAFYKLKNSVYLISQGKVPERIKKTSRFVPQEVYEMEQIVNEVAEKREKRLNCIEKISNGDFISDLNIVSGTDEESDLLLDLRKKLSLKNEQDNVRKSEEEHLDWINAGITKFIEILRFHGQDRSVLAYNIISNLVRYVDANQGAIYFTDDEDPNNVMLDMAACFAYEKQKLINKRISVDEGLLGRAYHEGRIINITDLPDGYIHIVSGLGDSQPSNLIIVPLIFNQKNSGMIEVASFKVFKDYEITFLERIAESIASAISGLKITERTETLLQQSQEQSKLMKIQEVEMRRNLVEMRRLRDETESKESEMRGLFHAIDATSLVMEYDRDGTIIHVNSRVTDLFQMPEEELLGKNHYDISSFTPENKEYIKFWDDLRAGSTRSLVESVSTKQKVIWLSETFSPIIDDKGNVVKIINIGMDISETKVLERQLRHQEREINRQLDKMNEKERELEEKQKYIENQENEIKSFEDAFDKCIVRVDFNRRGIILRANDMFAKIVSSTVDEVLNHDMSEYLVPETVTLFDSTLTLLNTGNEYTDRLKFSIIPGKVVVVESHEFPIFNEKGEVDRIMLIGSVLNGL